MADYGWSMPAGAEEAKDLQDQRDADWDAALAYETEFQIGELAELMSKQDKDTIKAISDQLCDKLNEIVSFSVTKEGLISLALGEFVEKKIDEAMEELAEIMAIKKLESR